MLNKDNELQQFTSKELEKLLDKAREEGRQERANGRIDEILVKLNKVLQEDQTNKERKRILRIIDRIIKDKLPVLGWNKVFDGQREILEELKKKL